MLQALAQEPIRIILDYQGLAAAYGQQANTPIFLPCKDFFDRVPGMPRGRYHFEIVLASGGRATTGLDIARVLIHMWKAARSHGFSFKVSCQGTLPVRSGPGIIGQWPALAFWKTVKSFDVHQNPLINQTEDDVMVVKELDQAEWASLCKEFFVLQS